MKWIEFILLVNAVASIAMQINVDSHVHSERKIGA